MLTQSPQRSEREAGGFFISDVFPRLRDTLTRGVWIGGGRPHRAGEGDFLFLMISRGCGTRSRVDFGLAEGARNGRGRGIFSGRLGERGLNL